MKIKKVTLTGPDDTTPIHRLFLIQERFPFVEWGILCSRSSQGGTRFPSMKWRNDFAGYLKDGYTSNISCHLCGRFVEEILMGEAGFASEIGVLWNSFQRVQINTHGRAHEYSPQLMPAILGSSPKEFIFQYDNANEKILQAARAGGVNCSALFDLSHGAGVLPGKWPRPLPGIRCGYAGGLSPTNVSGQLDLIATVVPEDAVIWIDAETHIRSNKDKDFDFKKVEDFLYMVEASGYLVK